MADLTEVLKLAIESSGEEDIDAISAALKAAAAASDTTKAEISQLVTELGTLRDQTKNVDGLIAQKAALEQTTEKLTAAKAALADLDANFSRTDKSSRDIALAFNTAEKAVASLTAQQYKQATAVQDSSTSLTKAGVDVENLAGAHDELAKATEAASGKLVGIATTAQASGLGLQKVGEAAEGAGEKSTISAKAIEFLHDHLIEIVSVATAAEIALKGIEFGKDVFSEGLKAAEDVQDSLTRVQAVAKGTAEQFAELPKVVEEAAKSVNVSAEQAADGVKALTARGFDLDQTFSALVPTLQLAKIAQVDLTSAAGSLTTTLRAFNLPASDAQQVVDLLTAASHGAAGGLDGISKAAATLAPDAQKLGLTLSGTVAILQALQEKGIDSEKATRALRTVLQDLENPTSQLRTNLFSLGDGTNNFSKAVVALNGNTPRAKDALRDLTGESRSVIEALGQAGPEALAKFQAKLDSSGGSAKSLSDKLDDDVHGALTRFKNAFGVFSEDLAKPVLKPLQDELELLAARLSTLASSEEFEKVTAAIGKFATNAFAALNHLINDIDWENFGKNAEEALSGAAAQTEKLASAAIATATAINKTADLVGIAWDTAAGTIHTAAAAVSETAGVVAQGAGKVVKALDPVTDSSKAAGDALETLGTTLQDVAGENAEKAQADLGATVTNLKDLAGVASEATPHVEAVGEAAFDAGEHTEGWTQKMLGVPASLHKILDASGEAQKNIEGLSGAQQEATNAYRAGKISLDQLSQYMKLTGVSSEGLKTALENQHISGQAALKQLADDAAISYASIRAASKGSAVDIANERNSFLDYASKRLAATQQLSDSEYNQAVAELRIKAAIDGTSDATEKLITASNARRAAVIPNIEAETDAIIARNRAIGIGVPQVQANTEATDKFGDAVKTLGDASASGADKQKALQVASDNVTNSTEKQTVASEKSSAAAGGASEAFKQLVAAVNSVRDSFAAISPAATSAFDSALQGALKIQGIMPEIGQAAKTAAGALEDLRVQAQSDVVGIDRYYYALALAQAQVTDKINEQKAALDTEVTSLQTIGVVGQDSFNTVSSSASDTIARLTQLDGAIKSGSSNFNLLSETDLSNLDSQIQAAITRTQALKDAVEAADEAYKSLSEQLQDTLDQANGNDTAVEDRRFQKQLADLKAAAAAANDLNSAQYQQDVKNANALHEINLKNIKSEADAKNSSSGTTSGNSSAGGSSTSSVSTPSGSGSSPVGLPAGLAQFNFHFPSGNSVALYGEPANAQNVYDEWVQQIAAAKRNSI